MANVFAPFGFKQQTSATGAPSNFQMIYKQIAYDNNTPIYTGDPVKLLNTGYIAQWTAATAVSQLAGIFAGCEFLSTLTGKIESSPKWPGSGVVASTAQSSIVAKIIPCNLAIPSTFLVQAANASITDVTGVTFEDVGENIDVALGTGNATTGISGAYIDLNTLGTTATLPFRIVGLYGGLPGAGGAMGIQPGTSGPYGGSALAAFNYALVTANVSGAGSTGI